MARHLLLLIAMGLLTAAATLMYSQSRGASPTAEPLVQPPLEAAAAGFEQGRPWSPNARALDRVQAELGLTETEWALLLPKIEPVVQAQRELRRGSGAWGRSYAEDDPETPLEHALYALRAALNNPDASAAELGERVAAVRAAREEVEQRLAAAQAELTAALSEEETARMVLLGLLR